MFITRRSLLFLSLALPILRPDLLLEAEDQKTKLAPIGLNLDTNEQTYVDLVQPTARFDASSPGDTQGWLTGDFQFVLDNRYIFGWVPGAVNIDPLRHTTDISGVYRLSFRGQANLSGPGLIFSHPVYETAANITTVDVTVGNPPGGVLVMLQFSQTKRLPSDAPGTGVTDVHFLRPGYEKSSSAIFTPLWLSSLIDHPWSAFRFMGVLGTNNYADPATPEVYPYRLKWATDRAIPGTGPLYGRTHPGVHGMPWEQVAEVANQTKRDIWINIPVNASDDYIRQLALLLKKRIKPQIHIYVEYSNEMWHYGFFQGPWNMEAAKDEVAAGHTNLNYDGTTDMDVVRFRRIAKRTVEIGQQFRTVFADAPHRIRPVINNAFTDHDPDMLTYVTKNYGPPARFLYAIAQTAYYTSADKSSAAAILAGEKKASDANRAGYIKSRTIATFYGLHSLTYEGGQDEEGNKQPITPVDTVLPFQFAAARSPGMADVESHDMFKNWFPSGGGLYMQYSQVGYDSTYGMWGLSDDLHDQSTGKWRGMIKGMKTPLPPISAGAEMPIVPGAAVHVPANSTTKTTYIQPSPALWQMLLIRVTHAGKYAMTLSGTQDTAESGIRVMADNALAGTITLPLSSKGAGNSTPVDLLLTPGLHALFVFVDGPSRIVIQPSDKFSFVRMP